MYGRTPRGAMRNKDSVTAPQAGEERGSRSEDGTGKVAPSETGSGLKTKQYLFGC